MISSCLFFVLTLKEVTGFLAWVMLSVRVLATSEIVRTCLLNRLVLMSLRATVTIALEVVTVVCSGDLGRMLGGLIGVLPVVLCMRIA